METRNRFPGVIHLGVALLIAGLAGCGSDNDDEPVATAPPPPPTQPLTCAQLNGRTVPASAIGLPTTGAVVTSTEVVAASGTGATAIGEHCRVLGDINPVDPAAPKIKFQLNLPTNWNNKAMMFGGGGYNGNIPSPAQNVPAGPTTQPTPQGRGYATFSSDSGHQAGAGTFGTREGSFGANNEALNNFSSDALKKTRDTAIFLLRQRYNVANPTRTYFAGGSTGGREALAVVQKWPQDFDGAIVFYPAWNAATLDLALGRVMRAMAAPNGYPNREKRLALYTASLQACDSLDGAADNVVSNVDACNATFNPATATLNGAPLRCPDGGEGGNNCLSDPQIASLQLFNQPITFSYPLASGENQYPGFNVWGADLGMPNPSPLQPTVNTLALGDVQPALPATLSMPYAALFWDQWVKYFVTRDPNFNSLALDPQNPGPWAARISELTAIQDINRTDLSAFEAKGGKVLMAHGLHDVLVSSRSTAQYFERVRNTMGAQRVNNFMRYYQIPGYGHAVSTTFNASWDSLTALENWVERGAAPASQVVTDTAGVPGRTRPLCEYPAWPRYSGTGDINAAASYSCVTQ